MLSDKSDIGKFVVCQLHVYDVLHTLCGSFHDLDAVIIDVLVDEGENLLLFLVDVFHFLRNYILFLGTVLVNVDQVHSILLSNLKN